MYANIMQMYVKLWKFIPNEFYAQLVLNLVEVANTIHNGSTLMTNSVQE